MRKTTKKIVVMMVTAVLLTSCATGGGTKEDLGRIVGGFIGGAVAAKGSKKKNRAAAIVIGAGLGAIIGGRIGANLDARDRAALAKKIKQSASSNRPVAWRSNHSKSSAVITPVQTRKKEVRGNVQVRRVQAPARRVTTNLVVKRAPHQSAKNEVVFTKDERLAILALTRNGQWARVKNSKGQTGYVKKQDLAKRTKGSRRTRSRVKNEAKVKTRNAQNELPMVVSRTVSEAPAVIQVACRKVRVRSKVNGRVVEDYVETCQSPDGSWGA